MLPKSKEELDEIIGTICKRFDDRDFSDSVNRLTALIRSQNLSNGLEPQEKFFVTCEIALNKYLLGKDPEKIFSLFFNLFDNVGLQLKPHHYAKIFTKTALSDEKFLTQMVDYFVKNIPHPPELDFNYWMENTLTKVKEVKDFEKNKHLRKEKNKISFYRLKKRKKKNKHQKRNLNQMCRR